MLERYVRWLHTGWPAGTVEKLPEVGVDGATAIPGVRIAGDLTGIPLLKFAVDTGARAVRAFLAEDDFRKRRAESELPQLVDLAIIGGGVAGLSAALEAKRSGLRFRLFEATEPLSTIQNFPKQKPIFTYPTGMQPTGELTVSADIKEALFDELEAQRLAAGIEMEKRQVERIERRGAELAVHFEEKEHSTPLRALRVLIAIGRSGNYRALDVPGETLDKVYHRLYDPNDFHQKQVLVVGGGDSAVESAIALGMAGAAVTLSYRKKELSRPKPENLQKLETLLRHPDAEVQVESPDSERVTAAFGANMPHRGHGSVRLLLGSRVAKIEPEHVELIDAAGQVTTLPNDVVFAMIGREAPLDFFRRSGVPIRGEWRLRDYAAFGLFLLFCLFLYNWKGGGELNRYFSSHKLFPFNLPELGAGALGRTLTVTFREPGFYYALAYSLCVTIFGFRRIRRRATPYITTQTLTLMAVQLVPLFVLPYFVLPYFGHAGLLDHGVGKQVADHLFPVVNYGHGREYWRAFGLVLAWPLFIWNLFTPQPMSWWLAIGLTQTFVLIPLIVYRWGKGAYCGWICTCGALSETLGDEQRTKMPHGPVWNRVNLVGQVVLFVALVLFAFRVVSWVAPSTMIGAALGRIYGHLLSDNSVFGLPLDYYHLVDMFLAGIIGVGCYFWFSGRVWCRFACPLAALMHIYARLGRFRIFAEKKKCISCNVCTAVCHQGIDVMSFAQKGLPMEDPQCVRCSACVQSCPTGTLSFGRLDRAGQPIYDRLAASPVLMREGRLHLRVAG
jgi:NosR/NirI family nitrous oxide reductase transcriptional regulator